MGYNNVVKIFFLIKDIEYLLWAIVENFQYKKKYRVLKSVLDIYKYLLTLTKYKKYYINIIFLVWIYIKYVIIICIFLIKYINYSSILIVFGNYNFCFLFFKLFSPFWALLNLKFVVFIKVGLSLQVTASVFHIFLLSQ